jgi:DNA invertase Pin-like site-specific DNA recombinase
MAKVGYARVSSKGQSYQAQVEALQGAGCERVYSEKASGKDTAGRPQFRKMLKALLPGDIVYVSKLDRLCRSTRDLMNTLHELEAQGCGLVSLGEQWCDTTSSVGRLMVTIMSGIATFERELIKARTDEGIARARKRGTKFGRKVLLSPEQQQAAAERYAAGDTLAMLAKDYKTSIATMSRALS